jgi:hypothetical protein
MIRGLIGALVRLVLLPVKLAIAVVEVAVAVVARLALAPARVGWAMTRRAGWLGTACFGAGLAAGLLLAPVPGRQLRAKLAGALAGGVPDDAALMEAVTFELAHAPRTWHLPQPELAVVDGVVVLRGEVPHATAAEELVRAAGAVPGVRDVRDELALAVEA